LGAWCMPATLVVAQLAQPATVTFDTPEADGSLTVHWTLVSGANDAELQLVPGDGSPPVIVPATGTSHRFAQLLTTSNTTCLIQVRAFTNQYSCSAWSTATLPAPATFSFTYHGNTGEIIASWEASTIGNQNFFFLQAFAGTDL